MNKGRGKTPLQDNHENEPNEQGFRFFSRNELSDGNIEIAKAPVGIL